MTCLHELITVMRLVSLIFGLNAFIIAACAIVASVYADAQTSELSSRATKTRVYISTYTDDGTDGIFLAEFDLETGNLQLIRRVSPVKKASFLALHPNHCFLYSTCEVDDYVDSKRGAVASFKIDPVTGNLTQLNHQSSF